MLLTGALLLVQHAQASLQPRLNKRVTTADQPILDYQNYVCYPRNSSGAPDLNAPCNLWSDVYIKCTGVLDTQNLTFTEQKDCFCANPWADALNGCFYCNEAHGLSALDDPIEPKPLFSWTSSYCSATASRNFVDELNSAFPITNSINFSRLPTTWTDPIGNKTAVSLYYTSGVLRTTAASRSSPTSTATSSGHAAMITGSDFALVALAGGIAGAIAGL